MPRQRRIVRRKPLSERLMEQLNPLDFWLWLSEEIETRDWDSKTFGTQLGLAASFVFLLARANSGASLSNDDIFADKRSWGWGSFIVHPIIWTLIVASLSNAFYTVTRSRHYRLFEANVEDKPSTPSAQRVRVDSSPVSSSPLRLLGDMMVSESAESRAHPDKTRDVWEIAVWDPLPVSLQFFCFFSPGHVLVYWLFLPLTPLDPQPSVSVFNCLLLQIMLTAQLLVLQSRFSQQNKDSAVIQREVMHEYDVKYVHPRLHPVVREVATQVDMDGESPETDEVEVGTPATLIRRGFKTHPNQNYAKHFDPDNTLQTQPRNVMNPSLFTPATKPRHSDSFSSAKSGLRSSAMRQSLPAAPLSNFSTGYVAANGTPAASTPGVDSNYGGHLGVYSHVNSPLKKATSMGDMKSQDVASPRNSREMAALEQRAAADRFYRQSSPLKEDRRNSARFGQTDQQTQSTNPFARPNRFTQERFPSRWA